MRTWLLMNPPTGNYIRDTRCQASVDDIFAVSNRAPADLAYIAGAITKMGMNVSSGTILPKNYRLRTCWRIFQNMAQIIWLSIRRCFLMRRTWKYAVSAKKPYPALR